MNLLLPHNHLYSTAWDLRATHACRQHSLSYLYIQYLLHSPSATIMTPAIALFSDLITIFPPDSHCSIIYVALPQLHMYYVELMQQVYTGTHSGLS